MKKIINTILFSLIVLSLFVGTVIAQNPEMVRSSTTIGSSGNGDHLTNMDKYVVGRTAIDKWEVNLTFEPMVITEVKPIDIAIVVDTSGSMAQDDRLVNMKNSVIDFVNNLKQANRDVRVSLVQFNSDVGSYVNGNGTEISHNTASGTKVLVPMGFNNYDKVISQTNAIKAGGGTNTGEGIRVGQSTFANTPSNRDKIMILLSDGEPTLYTNEEGKCATDLVIGAGNKMTDLIRQDAIDASTSAKNSGIEIYSVGFGTKDDPINKFASDPKSQYYIPVGTDGIKLQNVFRYILKDISGGGLHDEMGPEVNYVENSANVTVSGRKVGVTTVSEDVLSWFSNDSLENKTHTVSYEVTPDGDLPAGLHTDVLTNGLTRYKYMYDGQWYYEDYESPTIEFTIADANVIYSGLPEGATPPTIISDSKIYTGFDETTIGGSVDLLDKFTLSADITIDGVEYYPTITYTAEGKTGGTVKNNLPIVKNADGTYSISDKDLGGGTYTFDVVYQTKDVGITYHANNTVNASKPTVTYTMKDGSTHIVKNNMFIPEDTYNFVGWNTSAEGTGDSYIQYNSIKIIENMDLYAQWEAKTYLDFTATPYIGVYDGVSHKSMTVNIDDSVENLKLEYSTDGVQYSNKMPDVKNLVNNQENNTPYYVRATSDKHLPTVKMVYPQVTPRPVIIEVNNSGKVVNTSDPANYGGFTVERQNGDRGVVAGEDLNVRISRPRKGIDESVDTYLRAITALIGDADVAKNYVITIERGDFVITGSDEIIVIPPTEEIPPVEEIPDLPLIPTVPTDKIPDRPIIPVQPGAGGITGVINLQTGAAWSLFDLLMTLLVSFGTIFYLTKGKFDKNKDMSKEEEEFINKLHSKYARMKVLMVIETILIIILLLITQDFTLPMTIFDIWSIVFFILFVIFVVFLILGKKKRYNKEKEEVK